MTKKEIDKILKAINNMEPVENDEVQSFNTLPLVNLKGEVYRMPKDDYETLAPFLKADIKISYTLKEHIFSTSERSIGERLIFDNEVVFEMPTGIDLFLKAMSLVLLLAKRTKLSSLVDYKEKEADT